MFLLSQSFAYKDKVWHLQLNMAFLDVEELRGKRKKMLKKDNASKLKSLVDEVMYALLYIFLLLKLDSS